MGLDSGSNIRIWNNGSPVTAKWHHQLPPLGDYWFFFLALTCAWISLHVHTRWHRKILNCSNIELLYTEMENTIACLLTYGWWFCPFLLLEFLWKLLQCCCFDKQKNVHTKCHDKYDFTHMKYIIPFISPLKKGKK